MCGVVRQMQNSYRNFLRSRFVCCSDIGYRQYKSVATGNLALKLHFRAIFTVLAEPNVPTKEKRSLGAAQLLDTCLCTLINGRICHPRGQRRALRL